MELKNNRKLSEKKQAVYAMYFNSAFSASIQRSGTYSECVDVRKKREFKRYIFDRLRLIEKDLKSSPISYDDMFTKIQNFKDDVEIEHKDILNNGCYKYGVAQKVVNVYLKLVWSAGLIKNEPPHCPIDSLIIKALSKYSEINLQDKKLTWTTMIDANPYREIMDQIKSIAGTKTIAVWELEAYNNSSAVKWLYQG